jgi:hypothetical protein
MGESERGIQSPIELLRQLIEESGRWTEDLVRFTRTMLVTFLVIQPFFIYFYTRSVLNFLSGDGPVFPVIIGIPLGLYIAWGGRVLYRRYRAQIRRRDNWVRKFDVLKKKEEEIEKLLSEEAG